jgi:tetratricopeptide (TPR) repeat protein
MRGSLLVVLFCVWLPVLAVADPTVAALMGQAQRAYVAGDYDTAKELFNEVLQADPQNTLAIQFIRNINLKEAGKPDKEKDPLKTLMLPKIEFKDATFAAALGFFKDEAAKQAVTVSFVPQLPEAQMEHSVTLSLSNIPFLDALRYLCEMNNAVYAVEPYAIVIKPVPADVVTPVAPAQ